MSIITEYGKRVYELDKLLEILGEIYDMGTIYELKTVMSEYMERSVKELMKEKIILGGEIRKKKVYFRYSEYDKKVMREVINNKCRIIEKKKMMVKNWR